MLLSLAGCGRSGLAWQSTWGCHCLSALLQCSRPSSLMLPLLLLSLPRLRLRRRTPPRPRAPAGAPRVQGHAPHWLQGLAARAGAAAGAGRGCGRLAAVLALLGWRCVRRLAAQAALCKCPALHDSLCDFVPAAAAMPRAVFYELRALQRTAEASGRSASRSARMQQLQEQLAKLKVRWQQRAACVGSSVLRACTAARLACFTHAMMAVCICLVCTQSRSH